MEVRLPGQDQVVFEFTAPRAGENSGVNHIAFLVDNCQEVVEDLKAKGIKFDDEAHFVVGSERVIASFRDPLGFRFQLTE